MNKFWRFARLSGLLSGGAVPVVYFLDEQNLTLDAAPVADPLSADPGPGVWDVTQANNEIAITADGMVITGADAFAGVISQGAFGLGGVGLFIRQSATGNRNYSNFGGTLSNSAGGGLRMEAAGSGTVIHEPGSVSVAGTFPALVAGTLYDVWVIRDSTGHVAFVLDGKLIWISGAAELTDQKVNLAKFHGAAVGKYKRTAVVDLPTSGYDEWTAQYDLATSHVASPSATEEIVQTPNAMIDLTIDALPSSTLSISCRRTDADNRWHVDIDSAGQIWLYERLLGSSTPRVSGIASDVGPGDRVRLFGDFDTPNDDWSLFVGVTKIGSYQGASNGLEDNTAAEIEALGGATISNFAAYPIEVSALVPSME